MKIRLTITIEVDEEVYGLTDQTEVDWLFNDILSEKGELYLHSNEIGDTVGEVTKVEQVEFVD